MLPHSWTIEAMKMVGIADNIVNIFENSKETWITDLIACTESLKHSNHLPSIIKQLPKSIEKRISETSFNKGFFDESIKP